MGKAAGLVAGLLGGVADTLQTRLKQKHDDQMERQREINSFLLDTVKSDDVNPLVKEEAWKALAQSVSGLYKGNVGEQEGTGKKKQTGNPVQDFLSKVMEPEALGSLLVGFHRQDQATYEKGGKETGGQDVAKGMPANPITGQASADTKSAGNGSTPAAARKSIFLNPEEKAKLQEAAAEAQAKGQSVGSAMGRATAAEELVKRGLAKDVDEAMEKFGLNPRAAKAAPQQGSLAADVLDAISVAEEEKGSSLSPAERRAVVGQVREERAKQTRAGGDLLKDLSTDDKDRVSGWLKGKGIIPSKATEEQVQQAMEATNEEQESEVDASRPDPKTGNIPSPRTGLTPNAVFQDASVYALEGRMPALGLGSAGQVRAARNAIQNKAAAIVDAAGVDMPTLQAEYKANATTLNRLVPVYRQTAGFAGTARDNLQLALDQSTKVPRTGSPIANKYYQWAKGEKLTGDPELTKFQVYIYTAAREYAKVTSGASASVAQLTDTAAQKAGEILNSAQTPAAFKAAVVAMQNDMGNVIRNQSEQINDVSSTVGQFLNASIGVPPPSSAPEQPSGQPRPAASKPTGSGVFVGTDGKWHTGSATGPIYKPGG